MTVVSGTAILNRRLQHKLTGGELARRLAAITGINVKQPDISAWETGACKPPRWFSYDILRRAVSEDDLS